MTATDELRRMLDERGVEWMDDSDWQLWRTVWHGSDGKQWRMNENRSGMLTELRAWQPTPEQAIEATLGRGTCEWCGSGTFDGQTVMMSNHGWQTINYCPNCGRRVS